jgi:hypothetical protein
MGVVWVCGQWVAAAGAGAAAMVLLAMWLVQFCAFSANPISQRRHGAFSWQVVLFLFVLHEHFVALELCWFPTQVFVAWLPRPTPAPASCHSFSHTPWPIQHPH